MHTPSVKLATMTCVRHLFAVQGLVLLEAVRQPRGLITAVEPPVLFSCHVLLLLPLPLTTNYMDCGWQSAAVDGESLTASVLAGVCCFSPGPPGAL